MSPKRKQRGSTLVEAALTLPILFMFILGVLEFGRAYNIYQTLTNAAREGARFSVAPYPGTSTLPSSGDVTSKINSFLSNANISNATVSVNQTLNGNIGGEPTVFTQVIVSAPYTFIYFKPFGTVTLSTQSVMRNETN